VAAMVVVPAKAGAGAAVPLGVSTEESAMGVVGPDWVVGEGVGRGVVAAVGSRALAGWELEAWGAAKVQGMLATVAG